MKKIIFLLLAISIECCGILPIDNIKPKWEKDYCKWLEEKNVKYDSEEIKNKPCQKIKTLPN